MATRNLYADTPPGATYPEYISLNERDLKIVLTVRGPAKDPSETRTFLSCGDTVDVVLTHDRMVGLHHALGLLLNIG